MEIANMIGSVNKRQNVKVKYNKQDLCYKLDDVMEQYAKEKKVVATLDFDDVNIVYNKSDYDPRYYIQKETEEKIRKENDEIPKPCDEPPYTYYSNEYEFKQLIHQNQYKKKALYSFWKQHLMPNRCDTLFNDILEFSWADMSKLKEGKNQYVFMGTSNSNYYTIDKLNINLMNELLSCCSTKVNRHSAFLGKILEQHRIIGDIGVSYHTYLKEVEPMLFAQFSNSEMRMDWLVGDIRLWIKPIGYYTFHTTQKTPTNIDSIYYDTQGVQHTRNDYVIYQINDEKPNYTKQEIELAGKRCSDNLKVELLLERQLEQKPKKNKNKKKNKKRRNTTGNSAQRRS